MAMVMLRIQRYHAEVFILVCATQLLQPAHFNPFSTLPTQMVVHMCCSDWLHDERQHILGNNIHMEVLETLVSPHAFSHQIRELLKHTGRHQWDPNETRWCTIALLCWVNLLNLLDLLPMVHVNLFPKNVKTIPIVHC